MIRFLSAFVILASGCTVASSPSPQNTITTVDIDKVEGNAPAQEFARLCLSGNQAIDKLADFARADGWMDADLPELKLAGLGNLHRTILEVPGGGGRYREAQILLQYNSRTDNLVVNMMERFDRQNKLVRTECSLYAISKPYLPICTAVGILLNRPPDSNRRFKHASAHFIRWNVTIANRSASVRCDGVGPSENAKSIPGTYIGTTISVIVDQTSKPVKKHTPASNNKYQAFL